MKMKSKYALKKDFLIDKPKIMNNPLKNSFIKDNLTKSNSRKYISHQLLLDSKINNLKKTLKYIFINPTTSKKNFSEKKDLTIKPNKKSRTEKLLNNQNFNSRNKFNNTCIDYYKFEHKFQPIKYNKKKIEEKKIFNSVKNKNKKKEYNLRNTFGNDFTLRNASYSINNNNAFLKNIISNQRNKNKINQKYFMNTGLQNYFLLSYNNNKVNKDKINNFLTICNFKKCRLVDMKDFYKEKNKSKNFFCGKKDESTSTENHLFSRKTNFSNILFHNYNYSNFYYKDIDKKIISKIMSDSESNNNLSNLKLRTKFYLKMNSLIDNNKNCLN